MEVVLWRMYPGGSAGTNWDIFSNQWIAQCKPGHGVYGAYGWKGTEEGRDAKEEPILNLGENREPLKDFEEEKCLQHRWAFCHLREEEALVSRELCIS